MYSLKERNIYEYQDHEGKRKFGDPIAISIRFMDAIADMGTTADALLSKIMDEKPGQDAPAPMPGSPEVDDLDEYQRAVFKIAEASGKAFKIPVLDEDTGIGLPRLDLVLMYIDFLGYQGNVKKNTEDGLNGSLATDGLQEDSEEEDQSLSVTESGTASG